MAQIMPIVLGGGYNFNNEAHSTFDFEVMNIDQDIKFLDSSWHSEKNEKFNKNDDVIYELNSYGFRSDEFEQDANSILFSGDSQTFGVGLPLSKTWPRVLLDKINPEKKLYSVATPGANNPAIISNVFKYFKHYGNPKAIFICLTEPHRIYVKKDGVPKIGYLDKEYPGMEEIPEKLLIKDSDNLYNFYYTPYQIQQYLMLEQYCLSNNINLVSFSWVGDNHYNGFNLHANYMKQFKTFRFCDYYELAEHLSQKNTSEYWEFAKDNIHVGYGFSTFAADILLKHYKELYGDIK